MIKNPEITWSPSAIESLRKAWEFISLDSPANAKKVIEGIVESVDELLVNPSRYPADRFKKNNQGEYRAFEKYSYRIAEKIAETEILILRIRHIKQEPLEY